MWITPDSKLMSGHDRPAASPGRRPRKSMVVHMASRGVPDAAARSGCAWSSVSERPAFAGRDDTGSSTTEAMFRNTISRRPLHHRHRQREEAGGSPTYLPNCDAALSRAYPPNRDAGDQVWRQSCPASGSAGVSTLCFVEARSVGRCESARDLAGDRPPTDDDVSITRDGRRLDTPDKVIAFLDEINAKRTSATARG